MRYWLETLGCPKNQVDSEKLAGTLHAEGYARRQSAGGGRPGRRQHLCLHRGGPPGVDRHHPGPGRRPPARRPPGGHRLPGGALRRRAGGGPARGRPGGRLRRPGHPDAEARPAREPPVPSFDLLNLPRPAAAAPVGLRQGGRRLRPQVRLLRHPVVPGPAAVAGRRRHPGRGGVARTSRRSCWSPRTWRPTAATSAPAAPANRPRSSTWCEAVSDRVARTRLLYLYPSELSDGLIDVMGATGCPYFDLSLQHVSRSAAAPHAPLGRRRPLPGPHRAHPERSTPMPPCARRSSWAIPGETEDDHDQLLAFLAAADLDWAGFFPFSPEEGTYAAGLPDQVPAGSGARAPGRMRRAAGRHHRPPAPGPGRADLPGPRRRAGRGPQPQGGARDRRGDPDSGCACRPASGSTSTVTGAEGPDLDAELVRGGGGLVGYQDPGKIRTVGADHARPMPLPPFGCSPPRRSCCSSCTWGSPGRPPWPGPRWPAPTSSTAGWPAGRAPPPRGPSSIPWPTRCWSSGALGALAATGLVSWVPVAHHRRAGGHHQRLPVGRRPQRDLGAGPSAGQVQDRRPGSGRRV